MRVSTRPRTWRGCVREVGRGGLSFGENSRREPANARGRPLGRLTVGGRDASGRLDPPELRRPVGPALVQEVELGSLPRFPEAEVHAGMTCGVGEHHLRGPGLEAEADGRPGPPGVVVQPEARSLLRVHAEDEAFVARLIHQGDAAGLERGRLRAGPRDDRPPHEEDGHARGPPEGERPDPPLEGRNPVRGIHGSLPPRDRIALPHPLSDPAMSPRRKYRPRTTYTTSVGRAARRAPPIWTFHSTM